MAESTPLAWLTNTDRCCATFHRYPLGFHSCCNGCFCPAEFVAREIKVCAPSSACHLYVHRRKPSFVALPVRTAGFQLLPASTETSTFITGAAFDHATPCTITRPGVARFSGKAMTDF